jgi:hypothetical protein
MSPEQIRGYYVMAEQITPILHESEILKRAMKKALVDNLIEYGKHKLGMTDHCSEQSEKVTASFLEDCRMLGEKVPSYVRATGEVY